MSKLDSKSHILAKLKSLDGKTRIVSILSDNYCKDDIVFVSEVKLDISGKANNRHKVMIGSYICDFSQNTNFPEAKWDHIAGSFLMSMANQVGKILHCVCGNTNGVNLLRMDMKIRKPAPPSEISINLNSEMFVRFNYLYAKSKLIYFHKNIPFAEIECLTHGVGRTYDSDSTKEA